MVEWNGHADVRTPVWGDQRSGNQVDEGFQGGRERRICRCHGARHQRNGLGRDCDLAECIADETTGERTEGERDGKVQGVRWPSKFSRRWAQEGVDSLHPLLSLWPGSRSLSGHIALPQRGLLLVLEQLGRLSRRHLCRVDCIGHAPLGAVKVFTPRVAEEAASDWFVPLPRAYLVEGGNRLSSPHHSMYACTVIAGECSSSQSRIPHL